MGKRRKIPMEKRQTKEQRSVTFSKRRRGLFNKAAELSLLCNAQVALLVSSLSSKNNIMYSFGHSSVDAVIDAFLHNTAPKSVDDAARASAISLFETVKLVGRDSGDSKAFSTSKRKGNGGFWWEIEDFDKYQSADELDFIIERLHELKKNVMRRLNGFQAPLLLASASTPAAPANNDDPVFSHDIHAFSYMHGVLQDEGTKLPLPNTTEAAAVDSARQDEDNNPQFPEFTQAATVNWSCHGGDNDLLLSNPGEATFGWPPQGGDNNVSLTCAEEGDELIELLFNDEWPIFSAS